MSDQPAEKQANSAEQLRMMFSAIVDQVSNYIANLADDLATLNGDNGAKAQTVSLTQLQKLIGNAETLGFENLEQLCIELKTYFASIQSDNAQVIEFVVIFNSWLQVLKNAIQSPGDLSLIEHLYSALPWEYRNRLLFDPAELFTSKLENEKAPDLAVDTVIEQEAGQDDLQANAPFPFGDNGLDDAGATTGLITDDSVDFDIPEELQNWEGSEASNTVDAAFMLSDDTENVCGLITDDSDDIDVPDEVANSLSWPSTEETDAETISGLITDDSDDIDIPDGPSNWPEFSYIDQDTVVEDDNDYSEQGELAEEGVYRHLEQALNSNGGFIGDDDSADDDSFPAIAVGQTNAESANFGFISDESSDDSDDNDFAAMSFGDGTIDADTPFDETGLLDELNASMDGSGEFNDTGVISAGSGDNALDFDVNELFGEDDESPDPDNLLAVLAAELKQVSGQLQQLNQLILQSDDKQRLKDAVNSYQNIIERLMSASDALGLTGLFDVCNFIQENASSATEISAERKEKLTQLLAKWPALVIAYINDPKDDAMCMELIDHLQNSDWPSPLAGNKGRDLYASLAQGLDEIDGLEEQEARQVKALPEDLLVEIPADTSPELVDAFFYEAPTHTSIFSECVANISTGSDLQNNITRAQRSAHTLKGAANLIGVKGIANLAHHTEDILEYLATRHIVPPEPLSNLMQEASDCLESMVEAVQGKGNIPGNALEIFQSILNWANRVDNNQIRQDDRDAQVYRSTPPPAAEEPQEEKPESTQAATPRQDVIRVATDTIDEMQHLLEETAISIGQIQEHLNRALLLSDSIQGQDAILQQRRFELENLISVRGQSVATQSVARQPVIQGNAVAENFDSLEMDQYDELYSAAQAYIEAVSDSHELSKLVKTELDALDHMVVQQKRIQKNLQQNLSTTRMVKIDTIASRLQRTVRQACRATGKKVDLIIEGTDTLLDSDMLDRLADALMHLLRNAVDHGIEPEEQRVENSKPPKGSIALSFKQQGNFVVTTCQDDGGGLNYDAILKSAISKGLVASDAELEKAEIARLILQPGFSTRESATQVSGRGVGMDVVHNTIQEFNGSLEISDNSAGGTIFSIKLPITQVSSHCIIVTIHDEKFAIPTETLEQIFPPNSGTWDMENNELVYKFGQNTYRFKSLSNLLGFGYKKPSDKDVVLLARDATDTIAVTVDNALNSYDLVIKSTGNYVSDTKGTSGVAILGDGSVIAVLDIADLFRNADQLSNLNKAGAKPSMLRLVADQPKVLIVDDSLSVRKTMSQLVQDSGYKPVLARDGLEAVEILDKQKVSAALVDMEMPRMNGLELTRHIRSESSIKNLPIIMITSRSQSKHRTQAIEMGVSEYLTKPYTEDDLLEKIEHWINKAQ